MREWSPHYMSGNIVWGLNHYHYHHQDLPEQLKTQGRVTISSFFGPLWWTYREWSTGGQDCLWLRDNYWHGLTAMAEPYCLQTEWNHLFRIVLESIWSARLRLRTVSCRYWLQSMLTLRGKQTMLTPWWDQTKTPRSGIFQYSGYWNRIYSEFTQRVILM